MLLFSVVHFNLLLHLWQIFIYLLVVCISIFVVFLFTVFTASVLVPKCFCLIDLYELYKLKKSTFVAYCFITLCNCNYISFPPWDRNKWLHILKTLIIHRLNKYSSILLFVALHLCFYLFVIYLKDTICMREVWFQFHF